ncbi:hypothetical protein [Streptomyces sp. XY152]|uniref:hypothetical protein n=1 Tax=Streptomyces sp. XY152 TaxID=1415560 RepID=UPI0006AFEA58|nr:hypothetical protein [Streptomyces sp. XY152]
MTFSGVALRCVSGDRVHAGRAHLSRERSEAWRERAGGIGAEVPGDPEDAAIDALRRGLRPSAPREWFVEVATSARREQPTCEQSPLDLLRPERGDRGAPPPAAADPGRPLSPTEAAVGLPVREPARLTRDHRRAEEPVRVQEGRPLVLTGDGGTGRTRLLIGVGTAIAGAVLSVRRTTTAAPVNELAEAERGSRKTR